MRSYKIDYLYFLAFGKRQDDLRNDPIAQTVQDAHNKAVIFLRQVGMTVVKVFDINIDNNPIVYSKWRGIIADDCSALQRMSLNSNGLFSVDLIPELLEFGARSVQLGWKLEM